MSDDLPTGSETTTPAPKPVSPDGQRDGDHDQTLGQLVRELISTSIAYLRQNAAEAMTEVLCRPLRSAAVKLVWLGMALGAAALAAVMLGMGVFTLLADLLKVKSAAYGAASAICVLVAVLCVWVVKKDEGKGEAGK